MKESVDFACLGPLKSLAWEPWWPGVQTQKTLVQQGKLAQQSLSGVNLDEEAANLLRYQQAYQAAGKMIQIAQTLFQTVLDLR